MSAQGLFFLWSQRARVAVVRILRVYVSRCKFATRLRPREALSRGRPRGYGTQTICSRELFLREVLSVLL